MADVEKMMFNASLAITVASALTLAEPTETPDSDKYRVLITSLSTCSACYAYKSNVEDAAEGLKHKFIFKTILCDSSEQRQQLCNGLGIEAVPTTIVFTPQNQEKCRHVGAMSTLNLVQFLLRCVNKNND